MGRMTARHRSKRRHARPSVSGAAQATISLVGVALLLALGAATLAGGCSGTDPGEQVSPSSQSAAGDAGPGGSADETPGGSGGATAEATGEAADLVEQALSARAADELTTAVELFTAARTACLADGQTAAADACAEQLHDLQAVMGEYPYTSEEMLAILADTYPDVPAAEREAWLELPTTERREYDGITHYFEGLAANLAFRDVSLFRSRPEGVATYREIYETLKPWIERASGADPWLPFATPKRFRFTQALAVPREELPADGRLQVWFPLPIEDGPQTGVAVDSISPTTYMSVPPSTAADIGLLYLDVPLDELDGDLDLTIDFSFSHAPQYFTIDPERIGEYDTKSDLYRRYTRSHGNTAVTPSIRRTAQEVVGEETNPWLAAGLLYDHVVDEIDYSLVPHLCSYPRGDPESVYVHEHGYGDCGAQSMYYTALCRSVGIPARCTGGFQLFTGVPQGHFWAEVYLPDYGWVPVDTSAAQIAGYVPGLSAAELRAYRDFFFGNQDPLRLVVQRETDLPLIPKADGRVLLPLAVQFPAVLCPAMDDIPGLVLKQYWTIGR